MHYLLEGDFTSVVCYSCWCSHLNLYTFFIAYWQFAALLPPLSHSYPLSIFRSSFPQWVSTTALQTALTSAQKMTALLSSWRRGPAVPVHARASTAAIALAAPAAVAAALAALHRPKWKHSTSLTVLHPAPRQQLRVGPQEVQQRAAAARCLLLGRKRKTPGIQGCEVLLFSQVT